MFTIKNKLKIISAVILTISTAATVLTACGGEDIPEIPVETVIGTHGEILGVSVYTEENKTETQTVLYEITTKKPKDKNKTKKSENNASEINRTAVDGSSVSDETRKITVRNNSSGITLVSRTEAESTSRVRSTFPKVNTQKTSRAAQTFANDNEPTTKHVPVSYVPDNPQPKTTKKAAPTTASRTQPVTKADSKPVYDEKVSEETEGINIVFKTDSVEKGSAASIMIQGEPGKKYSIEFYVSPTETANLSALEEKTADENGLVTWTFNIPMSCSAGSKKTIIKEKNSTDYAQTSINVR